jgi:hypothetical protein
MTRSKPKPPTFDVLLAAIGVAPSAADLTLLVETARTYFGGHTSMERNEKSSQRLRCG